MIYNAIKDNLPFKRISLLFYSILFLFYPSLLLKDQTQHNHAKESKKYNYPEKMRLYQVVKENIAAKMKKTDYI